MLQVWAAAPASASQLRVLAVVASATDQQVSLIADVRTAGSGPVAPDRFTATADGVPLATRATPVISDELAVGVVVDASAAGAPALQPGLSGTANLLLQLPSRARVSVIGDTRAPALVAPLRQGQSDALRGLSTIRAGGARSTADAVALALGQVRSAPGPRLVVLYTGGADAGGEAADALARRLRQARAVLAVVSTGAGGSYWSQVAAATGGVAVSTRAAAATAAFDQLLGALRSRYVIGFPLPEELPTTVSVQVKAPDGTVAAEVAVPAVTALTGGGGRAREADPGGRSVPVLAIALLALVGLALAAMLTMLPRTMRPRAVPAGGSAAELPLGGRYRRRPRPRRPRSERSRSERPPHVAVPPSGAGSPAGGRYLVGSLVHFNRVLDRRPDDVWALSQRGVIHRLLGRYDDALADFDRAIRLKPEFEWAMTNRALTYHELGRDAEALADLDRAIELTPDYESAIASRARIYQLMGHFREALADLDRLIELQPGDGWTYSRRADLYRQLGRDAEAAADFDRADQLGSYGGQAWPVFRELGSASRR